VHDRLDSIRVVGARENNLKDVSLSIPKNRITVFVGVSGSGKSSIVFDTVAVEAQRQLNATFPWFIRNQLPKYERPHVDAVENLTTPVIVDQRPLGGNARSTVGTISDIYSMIRVLFARHGEPSVGQPSAYSFNDPKGMCPECEGLGRALRADPDLMLDQTRSLDEGAILLPGYPVGSPGRLQISDLIELLATIEDQTPTAMVGAIRNALERIAAIGLGYLSLDRTTSTLSGGEGQRLKLVKHLGSDLTGLTYIFDEPSVGLHPRDVGRLNDLLRAC